MFGLYDDPRLFDVARQVCHQHGIPWTDPRTGVTYPPPMEARPTVAEAEPDDSEKEVRTVK